MRPLISHAEQGSDAYLAGRNEAENPHREGTTAHVEWLGGHLARKVDSGDLVETDHDCAKVYLDDTVLEAGRTVSGLRLDLPTAASVADAIDLPVEQWRGKCFAVSVATLESGILDDYQERHGALFPTYGIYDGPLGSGRQGFNRHGWLESVEGHVVDPTRWVFTNECPHIWAGPIDDYDLGGMRLRSRYRPTFAPVGEGNTIPLGINDKRDLLAFDRMLRNNDVSRTGMIAPNLLHWILTAPIEVLGTDANLFIKTADRLGKGGLVPTDTRLWLDFSTNGYDPSKLRVAYGDLPIEPQAKRMKQTFSPFN